MVKVCSQECALASRSGECHFFDMALDWRFRICVVAFAVFLCGPGHEGRAEEKRLTPVVIPKVKGTATTTKFGEGYITRSSEGTRYTTSKFGSGWITRSSDGKTFTTTKFGTGQSRGGWTAGDDEPLWFRDDQPVFGRNDHDHAALWFRVDQPEYQRGRCDEYEVRQRLPFAGAQIGWHEGPRRGAGHSGTAESLIPPAGARQSAG